MLYNLTVLLLVVLRSSRAMHNMVCLFKSFTKKFERTHGQHAAKIADGFQLS